MRCWHKFAGVKSWADVGIRSGSHGSCNDVTKQVGGAIATNSPRALCTWPVALTSDPSRLQCECYDGWGSDDDIALYKAPDCSARVCPSGKAWADVPTSSTRAHALAECR